MMSNDEYYKDPRWDEVARLRAEAWKRQLGVEDQFIVEMQDDWFQAGILARIIANDHGVDPDVPAWQRK